MALLLRGLEAGLLTAMGLFMAVFALSDAYWQLLNPKYSWLTFGAGAAVILVGVGAFFHAGRRPRLSELLSIAVFLCLALAATTASDSLVGGMAETAPAARPGGFVGGSLTLHYEEEAVVPEVSYMGESFIRMNLAELLSGEEGGWTEAGGRYAVQGMVLRTPETDAAGYIGVGRLFIYCCLADAVGVVALVKVDAPQTYRSGSWVRALGILEEGAPFADAALRVPGSLSSARSDRFVLRGVEVEETPVEGVPFILDMKKESPFAY